jgi:bcr-type benzoyl-CoA reductase subunit C
LSKYIAKLEEISTLGSKNEYLRDWQAQGNKVMGWLCTYVPEELIYAAGILPIRVMGDESVDLGEADAYLHSNICSFARSCLALALKKTYNGLDGLIGGNTCDAMRRLGDIWRSYFRPPFVHVLSIPHKISEQSVKFYKKEIEGLKANLEEFIGRSISKQDLQEAIQQYNLTRTYLQKLNGLRVHDSPVLSGAEMLAIVKASMVLPRPACNALLENILADLTQNPPLREPRPRIIISGSVLDNPLYIKAIEDLGCWIVAEDLCTGSRYYWDLVNVSLDPIDALAQRYIGRIPCARMRPYTGRFNHLLHLVESFKADGVIYEKIKFCDLYGDDYPMFKAGLEERQIPHLELEREYGGASMGQIRTRIEAFLEMLTIGK